MQRQFFKCERATEAGWYGERSSRTIDMEWFTTNQKFQVFHFLLLLSSRSVMSSSLRPQELQHTRLLCSSLSSGVCPNSCPLNQSYRLILCCPLLLLSSIFTSIRSFPMSQFFESGGQSTGASASASVRPMNIQCWSLLGLTGLISLQSKGLSRVFSNTTVHKHQFFSTQLSLWSNSHIHTWLLGKP